MKKYDDEIKQIFSERFGTAPEVVGYIVDGPPLWLTILLAGGLFSAFLQKPWMMGIYGDEARFIKTSLFKTTSLKDETMTLKKSDISNMKFRKFGPSSFFTVTTTEGKTHRFVMNSLYRALEGQGVATEGMKKFLGVNN